MRETFSPWEFLLTLLFVSSQLAMVEAVPPAITQPPQNQTKFVGNTAIFTCAASGADSYEWLKNDRIPSLARWEDNRRTLEIKDVQTKDSEMKITCRAKNTAGESDEAHAYLTVLDPANLPPQPTAFAVHVLSSRSVEVSWSELEPGDNAADSFTIEYKKTGDVESDWEKRTDISDYSAEVDGLMPNREYKFRVFGVNKAGSGPKTRVVTKRTLEDVPSGPPTNVVVEATSAWQLNVKWDLPDDDKRNGNITKYQVKYEKSRVEKFIKNTAGSEREILLERSDGIKPYTEYSVSVSAFTAVGQGPFSVSERVETLQAAPDGPPLGVTAVPEGTGINVSWRAPSGALNGELVGYNITYMPSTGPGFKEVEDVLTTVITDLLPYTEYSVMVKALTDRMNKFSGPPSKAVMVKTNEQPPSGSPQHFEIDNVTHNSISVSWMAPQEHKHNGVLTYYVLQYCLQGKCSKKESIEIDIDTQSITIHDLEPHKMYTVSVMAKNAAGSGPPAERHIITKEAAPGMPESVNIIVESSTQLRVEWQPPTKMNGLLLGYYVTYGPIFKSNMTIRVSPARKEKVLSKLLKFMEYRVSVFAFTSAGPGPVVSRTAKTLEDVPSEPPDKLAIESKGGSWLELSWLPVREIARNGEITEYSIGYTLSGEQLWSYKSADAVDVRYNLTGLKADSRYSVKIRGHTSVGDGQWSSSIREKTDAKPPSGHPTNVVVTAPTAWDLKVTWYQPHKDERNGDIFRYQVRYTANGTTKFKNSSETKLLLEKADGIRPHTKYNVSVSALTSAGQGPFSPPAPVTTKQHVPGPPILRLRGASHHKWLDATWSPPEDPNGEIELYSLWFKESMNAQSDFVKNDAIPTNPRIYRIVRLIGNKTYSVHLRAKTAAGWGVWANLTGTTLTGPPEASPRNVNVMTTTNTSLEIVWDEVEPSKQHGIIRTYRINISSTTNLKLHHRDSVPGSKRSFVKEGLMPYTLYSIRVAAVTNGTGPYSKPIKNRTSESPPSKVLNVMKKDTTSKSIDLAWDEPSEKRGVIQDYEVKYRISGTSHYSLYKTKNLTKFRIERLIPYTSYEIIVTAVNTHHGYPSDVITVWTKEERPGPPRSVRFSHEGEQHTAHVSWEEPEKKNGILEKYTVTFRALKPTVDGYNDKGEIVLTAGERKHMFKNMQPNMQYNFTVSAHTSVGKGIEETTIGQIMKSAPKMTPAPKLMNDSSLGRHQKKIVLSTADEIFGDIQYYRLGVYHAPISGASNRQRRDTWLNYTAAHFGPDRVPRQYTVGDNTTYLNNRFRNKPLEMGNKYRFVFYAHVGEGVVGESASTETFELVLPTSPPEDNSDSGGFQLSIVIVIVVVVLALIIGLVVFIVCLKKRRQTEAVKDKVPPIDEVDLGDADTDDSIEYLRRQARNTMEKYPAVRMSDFDMHVKRLQANGNLKFSQEYESIRLDMDFTAVASNLAVNDEKNRYSNIVAYDHTRVRLSAVKGQQGSDYINANYIDGNKKKNAYIATQGPLKETAGDFWQMVWEQRSSTIVMLTNLEERGRPKCYKYWPDMGSMVFDAMEVTLKEVITLADYVVRTFALAKTEHPDEVREVKQLQFMSWPDHGVPTYATAMLAFQRKVKAANPPNAGPVVIHCSAGVGRTGAFIVIDAMLDRVQELDTIDVYGHVTVLRSQRNYMVQTEDQYFFIHEAMLEAIQCGDTEINAKDLPTAMQRLNEVVADDGSTAIELEFKRLAMDKLDPNRFSTANRPVNKNKNRFVNILPFENTRVVLNYVRGVDGSDYINASLVDGYKQRNAFIATQGPLKETEQEFWRMLWEQESKVIVMLTKLAERGQEKCHQYWPEGKPARYGPYVVVDPLSEQRKADCILRQFKMTNANDGSSRTVCQYQYVGWPENRSPVSGRALIDLIGEVQKLQDKTHDGGPVTVHCSAGVGRTGCFIALSVVLERMRCEGVLDIFQTVKMLRIQRPAMVQTLDQYQFVYDTALEYLDSFDHYADYAPLDVQEDEQEVD